MGERTIPAPTEHHFSFATAVVDNMVRNCGITSSGEDIDKLKDAMVSCIAHRDAEILWLRKLVHP